MLQWLFSIFIPFKRNKQTVYKAVNVGNMGRKLHRRPTDYSKSVLYKIICRDSEIRELYVGSTINLSDRTKQHKEWCEKMCEFKVYKFIRDHGGWENWDVVLLENLPCSCKLELSSREYFWIEQLKATLNTACPIARINLKKLQEAWKQELCQQPVL